MTSRLACTACGAEIPADALPFRCPNAGADDDVDHLIGRVIEGARFPDPAGTEANPFLCYRDLLHSRHFGRSHGLADDDLDGMVRSLDEAVAGVDGRGFLATPFGRADDLSTELGFAEAGGVFAKDETGNVGASHKGRHLFGLLHTLQVRSRVGLPPRDDAPLAIASCGNAAYAAAVLAKAGGRRLDVYVPPAADEYMQGRLRAVGANVTVCPRDDVPGDPSLRRFRAEVAAGAVPFTVQGSENGLVVEGAETLGWEMVSVLAREGRALDRLFVQVGGGALASACVTAFREARDLGVIDRLPRVHAVQARGGHPLERAYTGVVDEIYHRFGHTRPGNATAADGIRARFHDDAVRDVLRYAATHRSRFMWPWETPPQSVAHGILDDETYDWRVIVDGMLETGGWPIVVDDRAISRANETASRIAPVSFTGSAGLAGLVKTVDEGRVAPEETVAVLLTGRKRGREV